MNELETFVADFVGQAIQRASNESERSQQAKTYQVGMSDLGYCSERTRRMIDQQDPGDKDAFKAFIGTALGDHTEKAVAKYHPEGWEPIVQAAVTIRLPADSGRVYEIPGHPDLVFPRLVLDAKTSDGLEIARRKGADQQKRFQRNLYGQAAFEAGLTQVESLDDLLVGNVWLDRTGDDPHPHVEITPFDPDAVREATFWLDEVVDAYLAGREAMKEPPREVCAATCGFYETCRVPDTDVEGLITDEVSLTAIELYVEGAALEKMGKRYKDEAKGALKGVIGSTGSHVLRWTHINETDVPGFTRKGYDKVDIKPIKRPK